jgi:flagellar protein FlaG
MRSSESVGQAKLSKQTGRAREHSGLDKALKKLHQLTRMMGHKLQIEADLEGPPVIYIIERETGEVVREVPPEAMRKLAERIDDLRGLLLDQMG